MAKERFEIRRSGSYYFSLIAPNNENIEYDRTLLQKKNVNKEYPTFEFIHHF